METKIILENQQGEYDRKAHHVGISMWHLQWCTKYRYKMFRQEKLRLFCETTIKECCSRNKIEIIALNVQPDHVHVVVSLPRGMSDAKALQLLKGFSSFLFFRLVPDFRKGYPNGTLWAPSSFSAAVGYTELKSVVEYVKNQ
jgi:putative transposase